MKIKEAICQAKEEGLWSIVEFEPETSVRVEFTTLDGEEDETELDLWSDNPEDELESLWTDLCQELESAEDKVLSVEAYGYICE